jgi:hypothetical protein
MPIPRAEKGFHESMKKTKTLSHGYYRATVCQERKKGYQQQMLLRSENDN